MREPQRLSLASPNPLTRTLLRSGGADRPSPQARHSAAVALGVAGAVTATVTAASAGAAGASAGGAGTVTTSKWAAVAAIVKWVGAAATSGALAMGAAHEYGKLTRDAKPAMSEGATAPSAAGGTRARTSVPSAPLAGTSRAAPQSSAPAVAAQVEGATQADAPSASESQADIALSVKASPHGSTLGRREETARAPRDRRELRDEVRALDGVRSALSANDVASALEALRAYDHAFAGGALASEAGVLRIEVLARAGRRKEAIGVAQQWLSREPNGPQARYVRRLLDAMRSDALAPADDAHP